MMNDAAPTTVYHAGALRDAGAVAMRKGAIAVRDGVIVEVGEPGRVGGDVVVEMPDRLVLPSMVNAHGHLELCAIGSQPYGGDFAGWVRDLRACCAGHDEAWFARAARRGAEQSQAQGVFAVGDICRSAAVADAVRGSGVRGVSFVEYFALGSPWLEAALARMAEQASHGLQPHAPYSAGAALFAAAAQSGRRVSAHVAETPDEAQFVAGATGPLRALLESLGKWRDSFAGDYCHDLTPVQWIEPYLEQAPWLLAHCNYVSDDDIAVLAGTGGTGGTGGAGGTGGTGASVAYCPLASEYFGHENHRYRDMLDAGVNVCLGTDSIVCQPAGEPQPHSILAQMRRLYARDATAPALLLAMATAHGCRALGLDETEAALAQGTPARLIFASFDPSSDTDPLTQVLENRYPVQVLSP